MPKDKVTNSYLGDAVYVTDDGEMIKLYTRRAEVEHYIFLDDEVLTSLIRFLENSRNVKIEIVPRGTESSSSD